MGATAFLIAEFLGISYWSVCVAAVIPAILYYISVFMMVHFEARKLGLKPMAASEIPKFRDVLPRGYTVISLALMILLFALGYSVVLACLAGITSIILVSFINRDTRMSPQDFTDGLINGSPATLMVATACALCGIIIGSIFITGVGQRFTQLVLTASHGHLWIALILTAVAAYILGMGMPPAAVYFDPGNPGDPRPDQDGDNHHGLPYVCLLLRVHRGHSLPWPWPLSPERPYPEGTRPRQAIPP